MTGEAAASAADDLTHRFHLVVATNRSPDHLSRCVRGIEATGADFFLTVVEQHPTQRCASVIEHLVRDDRAEYIHDPDTRGVSAARNRGLARLRGEIIAFPDDDCQYTLDVLSEVDRALTGPQAPDGLAIRILTSAGASSMFRWWPEPAVMTKALIPYTICASGMFLQAATVRAIGYFDERLGTGAPTPFGSAEEPDLVLRALALGATIHYRPDLFIQHEDWRLGMDRHAVLAKALRYNRGFGKVMRKHGLVGEMCKWTARSIAGVVVRAAQLRFGDAAFQWVQLRGRVEGWFWSWDRQV